MPDPVLIPGHAGMPAPSERRARVIASLGSLRDPQARLQWAVEQARLRPGLPASLRIDAHRVAGCQVRLWWVAELQDGHWRLASDSDAATLKAMTGLLAECYDGETSRGIVEDPPGFLERLGLLAQLAENRRATVLRVARSLVDSAQAALHGQGSR